MKIIGLGNALLDVLLNLDNEAILSEMGVKKGAMEIIDEAQMFELQKAQIGLKKTEAPGGSVCNTMRSLAKLNSINKKVCDTGYIGKIGNDHAAKIYADEIAKVGVEAFFVKTTGISGCSTVLISPDGERTMATFLGPAATLADDEIPDNILRNYDLIYIEGYLIANERLFLPVVKRAKAMGLKIALDLSNFNIVNAFGSLLHEVIPQYVDILFSNESEAEAYTGLPAREAIEVIAKDVEISVVTIGKEGVLVRSADKTVHQAALKANVIDTTGAGDNFAAGFLYGYSTNASLEKSAYIGALLSSKVIEVVGARIPDDKWQEIKSQLSSED
ncbi:MAG: adenosine kinase [Tannerella sp.]|jgi:sugar/nucleoside kinase (ribokinase family)|nr:adenosine kinase [Tannerella sp.]